MEGFTPAEEALMGQALALAARAGREGEVPVGALVVDPAGRVLGRGRNQSLALRDPTAHAEMLAIRQAAAALGNYRLSGASLYVTLEPCPMCAGAVIWARLAQVVYAAADPKVGAFGSALDLTLPPGLNHRPLVRGGLRAAESAALLKGFFAARRDKAGAFC